MSDSLQDRLIARLKELRTRHGITQEQFSELSGIGYKYYQHIENGRRPDLRLSTLERLAAAYGIGVHQLLAPALPQTRIKKPPATKKMTRRKGR